MDERTGPVVLSNELHAFVCKGRLMILRGKGQPFQYIVILNTQRAEHGSWTEQKCMTSLHHTLHTILIRQGKDPSSILLSTTHISRSRDVTSKSVTQLMSVTGEMG